MDHREAAFADLRMLDAPAEVLDPGRNEDRLGRQLGGERMPLQSIESQEFLVHAHSLSVGACGIGKYAGGKPVAA